MHYHSLPSPRRSYFSLSIFTECEDTQKICVKFLPTSLRAPLQILFLLPGKTEPMYGIQEKFEQVFNDCLFKKNSLQQYIVHRRLNYKATYNCKILYTKIGNISSNPDKIIIDTDWSI